MSADCVFCKIICGEISSRKIYENKYCIVILDIAEDVDGHMVALPKKHVKNILDCDKKTLYELTDTVKLVSEHLVDNCGYDGVNLLNANNESAGQSVPHFHIHIIPRRSGDNIDAWPAFEGTKQTLDKVFQKIKIDNNNEAKEAYNNDQNNAY